MEKKLIVSPSPHVKSAVSTQSLMRDVVIALIPAFAVAVWVYGIDVVIVTAVSVAACMLTEFVITRYLLGLKSTLCDFSAALTGLLLSFNLPSNLPLGLVVMGAVVAIGIGKMSFGGLGRNPFNPALVGRVFLLISFPVQMTSFPDPQAVDGSTGATLLTAAKEFIGNGNSAASFDYSLSDMFIGLQGGSLGEIGAAALLLGFVYLLVRKVITWHIPVAVLGSMGVLAAILWGVNPDSYMNPMFHILGGGALLGAIYMATDYVSSPMTYKGMLIYGVGIGVITILIRTWGAYPEGMSFAILILNACVPLINKYVKPQRFGAQTVKQ
ncbi:MAG: RnfABCDGE type electron transport complex subunit D [Rikenellaceae bacterium]